MSLLTTAYLLKKKIPVDQVFFVCFHFITDECLCKDKSPSEVL